MTNIERNAALLQQLHDSANIFSESELERIIHEQFFDEAAQMDHEVIDAVLERLLMLHGEPLTEPSLRQRKEHMIYEVLKEVLNGNRK